ncbi:MAG TPA: respiratory nitrate reductase subunit gamma [Usitatibacter sp.]|nr:respiratory nitrate reductase subunit gamma [Usitatibacter sp.]
MTAAAIFAALYYAAAAVLLAGVAARIVAYARTPAPLKIPTTPAPLTKGGAALRLAREVVLFESLFKASLLTWLSGWAFHGALALVLLRHLRYFTQPVPAWVALVQPYALYFGLAMAASLVALWARRVLVDRVRYISTPSDHLMLALLLAIAVTGLAMKNLAHTDVVAVKSYFLGLLALEIRPLPSDALLAIHLALVAALAIVFPFSKLMHAPGLFFSPTRNQPDNPREARHLAPWAAELER